MNDRQSTNIEPPATDIAEGLPPTSPTLMHARDGEDDANIRREDATARQVFVAWEKWRVVYNAVLIPLVIARVQILGDDLGLERLISGALAANVCFCAGPVVEGYLCSLGFRRSIIRPIVAVVGTLVAASLAWTVPPQLLGPALH